MRYTSQTFVGLLHANTQIHKWSHHKTTECTELLQQPVKFLNSVRNITNSNLSLNTNYLQWNLSRLINLFGPMLEYFLILNHIYSSQFHSSLRFSNNRNLQWLRGFYLRPLVCWDCAFESRWGVDICLFWMVCVVR